MLSTKKSKQLVDYWIINSKEKRKTMKNLYKSRRYADCLFFGHLMLEQILKALIVKETSEHAPRKHNLPHLAKLAKLSIDDDSIKLLAKINEFNMQARYPDEKFLFYKSCTKSYTDEYYEKINYLYKYLCRLTKQKK